MAAQGRTHAVIVTGLGGEPRYSESFHAQASTIFDALIERHGLPREDVTYLGERVETDPGRISLRSTRANVLQTLAEIAQKAEPMERPPVPDALQRWNLVVTRSSSRTSAESSPR
ncbi:MAG: hypothetical protein R3253_06315, partial [Longimicrobiales bacterium]|nr:hypothetical protein [Longimicrobiales bacterium]